MLRHQEIASLPSLQIEARRNSKRARYGRFPLAPRRYEMTPKHLAIFTCHLTTGLSLSPSTAIQHGGAETHALVPRTQDNVLPSIRRREPSSAEATHIQQFRTAPDVNLAMCHSPIFIDEILVKSCRMDTNLGAHAFTRCAARLGRINDLMELG